MICQLSTSFGCRWHDNEAVIQRAINQLCWNLFKVLTILWTKERPKVRRYRSNRLWVIRLVPEIQIVEDASILQSFAFFGQGALDGDTLIVKTMRVFACSVNRCEQKTNLGSYGNCWRKILNYFHICLCSLSHWWRLCFSWLVVG